MTSGEAHTIKLGLYRGDRQVLAAIIEELGITSSIERFNEYLFASGTRKYLIAGGKVYDEAAFQALWPNGAHDISTWDTFLKSTSVQGFTSYIDPTSGLINDDAPLEAGLKFREEFSSKAGRFERIATYIFTDVENVEFRKFESFNQLLWAVDPASTTPKGWKSRLFDVALYGGALAMGALTVYGAGTAIVGAITTPTAGVGAVTAPTAGAGVTTTAKISGFITSTSKTLAPITTTLGTAQKAVGTAGALTAALAGKNANEEYPISETYVPEKSVFPLFIVTGLGLLIVLYLTLRK